MRYAFRSFFSSPLGRHLIDCFVIFVFAFICAYYLAVSVEVLESAFWLSALLIWSVSIGANFKKKEIVKPCKAETCRWRGAFWAEAAKEVKELPRSDEFNALAANRIEALLLRAYRATDARLGIETKMASKESVSHGKH